MRAQDFRTLLAVGALLTAGLLAVYVVQFVRKTREFGWS